MKKITSVALLGVCTAASLLSMGAQAQDVRAPYAAVLGDYEKPDSSRQARLGFGGLGLVGTYLTPNLALEGNFWGDQLKYKNGGGLKKQLGGGLDFNLGMSNGRFAWFGLAGGGVETDTLAFGSNNDKAVISPYVDLGVGVALRLQRHIAWRTEVRDYAVFPHDSVIPGHANILNDWHFRTGLVISLGTVIPSSATPPPPPPLPPPPPPPPPYVPVAPPPPPPACPPSHGFKMDANCHIITQTVVLHTVNFDFNKATLTPYAKSSLDEIAAGLAGQSGVSVEIGGHTDSKGAPGYNKKLSQKRAEAVKEYLVTKGVTVPMTAVGYGEEQPVASNKTEAGRAENRRVEFKISGDTQGQTEGGKAVVKVPKKK